MQALELPLTANQNSIPRELVFDVEVMLDDQLDTCAFPFIGGDVLKATKAKASRA